MLSALDSVLALLATDEIAESAESHASSGIDDAKSQPLEGEEPQPDEFGGVLEPGG